MRDPVRCAQREHRTRRRRLPARAGVRGSRSLQSSRRTARPTSPHSARRVLIDPPAAAGRQSLRGRRRWSPDTTGVCAVLADPSVPADTGCETFPDATRRRANGGVVTHGSACGACSSLQDLAVYLATPDLGDPVRECALIELGGNPAATLACIVDLGFTETCAQIWAFNSANTRDSCLDRVPGCPRRTQPSARRQHQRLPGLRRGAQRTGLQGGRRADPPQLWHPLGDLPTWRGRRGRPPQPVPLDAYAAAHARSKHPRRGESHRPPHRREDHLADDGAAQRPTADLPGLVPLRGRTSSSSTARRGPPGPPTSRRTRGCRSTWTETAREATSSASRGPPVSIPMPRSRARSTAYQEKYASMIARNGWTPESFAADYPIAIRIAPVRSRAW